MNFSNFQPKQNSSQKKKTNENITDNCYPKREWSSCKKRHNHSKEKSEYKEFVNHNKTPTYSTIQKDKKIFEEALNDLKYERNPEQKKIIQDKISKLLISSNDIYYKLSWNKKYQYSDSKDLHNNYENLNKNISYLTPKREIKKEQDEIKKENSVLKQEIENLLDKLKKK